MIKLVVIVKLVKYNETNEKVTYTEFFIEQLRKGKNMNKDISSYHNQVEKKRINESDLRSMTISNNRPVAQEELHRQIKDKESYLLDSDEVEPEPEIETTENRKEKSEDEINKITAKVKFGNEIKILLIPSVDLRVMCHVLGLQSVNDIKSANYTNVPLISLLLMETLIDYMQNKGYSFSGEIMFDQHGEPIPVTKHTWQIADKDFSFTRTGYIYFEDTSGNCNKNIVIFVSSCLDEHRAGLTCYSNDESKSKSILSKLDDYAKKHNCLRGSKLRNINVLNASFEECKGFENATWDNYYYEDQIKDVIELQIFGFLNNIEKHNKRNIFKRGVMMHGVAGTGKTSLGKIICHYADNFSVIWITPDLISDNSAGHQSIKLLYMLSDYLAPGVVILEDMDLFSSDRESGLVNNLSLGTLMNILDGIYSIKNMVTLATTNRIDVIETAIRNRPGRFDRMVEIPTLNKELRNRMFTDKLKEFNLDEGIIESLIGQTEDWTGAEVQELINSFHMHFIQKDEETNLHVDQELLDYILGTMAKFSLKEGRFKENLGFKS